MLSKVIGLIEVRGVVGECRWRCGSVTEMLLKWGGW